MWCHNETENIPTFLLVTDSFLDLDLAAVSERVQEVCLHETDCKLSLCDSSRKSVFFWHISKHHWQCHVDARHQSCTLDIVAMHGKAEEMQLWNGLKHVEDGDVSTSSATL